MCKHDPIVDTLGIPYSQATSISLRLHKMPVERSYDQLMNALSNMHNKIMFNNFESSFTNIKSLQLYKKFKFHEYKRKQNDRGSGIDSIYLEIQLGENNDYEKNDQEKQKKKKRRTK